MWFSTNGVVGFGTPSATWGNSCLPTTSITNAIMAFWDDLWTSTPGVCTATVGTAPNRQFVITTQNANFYYSRAGSLTFSVVLYEGSDVIDVLFGTMTGDPNANGSSATIGVQDTTGSVATQYSCNSGVISTGTRIRFNPVP